MAPPARDEDQLPRVLHARPERQRLRRRRPRAALDIVAAIVVVVACIAEEARARPRAPGRKEVLVVWTAIARSKKWGNSKVSGGLAQVRRASRVHRRICLRDRYWLAGGVMNHCLAP